MKKKSFSLVNGIFLIINLLFISLILLSYLANYIFPEKYPYIAYMGILYPYLLIINVLFVLFWGFKRHRNAFLSLIAIAIGFSFLPRLYQHKGKSFGNDSTATYKVLSYNVHIFGLYSDTDFHDSIFKYISTENPDIICLQEYFQNNKNHKNDSILKKILKSEHKHIYTQGKSNKFGLATFSKYPIVNTGFIAYDDSSSNKAIFTDIRIHSDTIRVYNIHFQSLHFDKEDYLFTAKVTNQDIEIRGKELQIASKRIHKKLQKGYTLRSKQVQIMVEHILSSPYPVIVCGDFNDVPCSYTYQQINNLLTDAFVKSGKGLGHTFYVNQKLPFRIDYIFYDKNSFDAFDFSVNQINFSDHFPIHTLLSLKNKE